MGNKQLLNSLLELTTASAERDVLHRITEAVFEAYAPKSVFFGVLVHAQQKLIEGHVAFRGGKAAERWVYCMADQPCELVYNDGNRVSIPADIHKNFEKKRGSDFESFLGLPINHPTRGTLAHIALYDTRKNHFDDLQEETLCLLQSLIEREYWKIHAQRGEQLAEILDQLEVGIHRTGFEDGKLLEINPYLSCKTGTEFHPKHPSFLWDVDYDCSVNSFNNEAKSKHTREGRYRLAEGVYYPAEVRSLHVGADSLLPSHLVSVVLDRTEIKRREADLQRALAMLETKQRQQTQALARAADLQDRIDLVSRSGGVGMMEFFPETQTFTCNAEMASRLGIADSAEERSIDLFYAHQTDEIQLNYLRQREAQGLTSTEPLHNFTHSFYLPSGEMRHYRVSRALRQLDGRASILKLSIDVTDEIETQRQIERQLAQINEQQQKQAQMFSIIGHELRTPLSSMKMMEDAMGLRDIGEYGANICDSTDAVLNIVDDLRTVINPDKAHQAQAVVDSPFDVLSRTTSSLEGLYEQQGVEVIVSSNQLSHSLCKFNAQALRQKITNLTKNAAIHADADTVWVDLQAQSSGDDKIDLTLIVEDNGKGIPEGLREAVFGAFSRGDTRADGTGLGLYITRELAEKLGGTVEYFESEKGGAGFRVKFTLDLHLDAIGQEQEQEQELGETAIPVALQDKRILFAEDQKMLQLLTGKQLTDAGADVVVCDNGKQALEAFRAGEFDIVLTDLMMPEMNGDELIRHVRADGFTGPVFALTAAIIGKETDTLLEAGADAVLNKPLEIHEMKRKIAELENKERAA